METIKFDDFRNYIMNVTFTKQKIEDNPNILYTDSLIAMLRQIHENYNEIHDYLIDLKPDTKKEAYNSFLIMLINKLKKLKFHENYDDNKIRYWLEKFSITRRIFFEWHDLIEDYNDLYLILDAHINWMEIDPILNTKLSNYDRSDLHEIQRIFEEYIKDHYVKELISFLEDQKFSPNVKDITEKYKSTIWFKVGLLFATGEMDKLLKDNNNVPKRVAKSLGKLNYEKYILATNKNYTTTNTDKNIYYSRDKMLKIIKHCKENNLPVIPDFTNRLDSNKLI